MSIMTAIIPLLAVFVGSLLTLLATRLTNKAANECMELQFEEDRAKLRREQLRKHAEDLYLQTSGWSKAFTSHFMIAIPVFAGRITQNAAMDIQQKQIQNAQHQYDFAKIEFLVRAYFPLLEKPFEEVLKARDIVVNTELKYRKTPTHGASSRVDRAGTLAAQIDIFGSSIDEFQRNLISQVASIDTQEGRVGP